MGIDSEEPTPLGPSLSKGQVEAFQRAEPKTLGAIQIIIAVLTLCLSVTLLQQEIHFTGDVKVLCVVVGQLILSGSVLVHAGRKPSVFWLKSILVLHLVSAAFATAALGLLSKHLPYRQDAYHCEHCYRLQNAAVMLIDGITGTLVLFLVLELVICIVAMLFGLNALANGSFQLAVSSLTVPTHQSPAVAASAAASAAAVASTAAAASSAAAAIPIPDPTEAVVEEPAVPDEPQVIVSSPRTQTPETPSITIDEPQVAPADMESETES